MTTPAFTAQGLENKACIYLLRRGEAPNATEAFEDDDRTSSAETSPPSSRWSMWVSGGFTLPPAPPRPPTGSNICTHRVLGASFYLKWATVVSIRVLVISGTSKLSKVFRWGSPIENSRLTFNYQVCVVAASIFSQTSGSTLPSCRTRAISITVHTNKSQAGTLASAPPNVHTSRWWSYVAVWSPVVLQRPRRSFSPIRSERGGT